MADITNKTASIYIDDAPARDAYDRLSKKADEYNKKIDEGVKKQEFLQKAIQKSLDAGGKPSALQKQLEKVNTTLDKNRKELDKVTTSQKVLQQQMDNKTGPTLKQQEALVRKLWNEYRNLGHNTDEAKKKLQEYGEASKTLTVMRDRINEVGRAQSDVGKTSFFGSFFGNLAANAVTHITSLVSDFFSTAVDEALEADETTARFKATLDNIGRSDAFDRLTAKADQVVKEFKYLDNDEVVSVFNKLIDYGKLTEKQMNDLLPVIINFGAKNRISVEESTSVIVKALEGNARALKEYGIEITESSTESERMAVIMGTLAEKVDGAAEAFQNSAQGGIAVAQQEFKNLKEEVGNQLIPVLSGLLGWVNKIFTGFGYLKTRIGEMAGDIKALFSDGISGFISNRAAREEAQREEVESLAATNLVKKLEGSTINEISEEISRQNVLLAQKNKLLAAQKKLLLEGLATPDDIKRTEQGIRVLRKEIDGLLKLQDQASNKDLLGLGGAAADGKDNAAKEKAAREAEAARKKQLEDEKKFQEGLRKLRLDYRMLNQSEEDKEVQQAEEKYRALIELAHGNAAKEKAAADALADAVFQIRVKYAQKELQELEKLDEEKIKRMQQFAQEAVKSSQQFLNRFEANLAAGQAKQLRDQQAKLELQILQANGLKKLALQKQQLEEEKNLALQNKDLTENEKLVIEEKYRQQRFQLELNFWSNIITQISNFVQSLFDIAAPNDAKATARENAELARLQKRNDKEKAAHQKLLNNKLISQQEFNRRTKAIDDNYRNQEAAAKRKQWERQQKADIQQAIVSGAQAILSALRTTPFLLGLVLAGVAAVRTKKQIDVIKAQSVPEFAKGGYLGNGPSHKEGGMPVINPRTGRKVAEVEGGEAILSKKTVRNNSAIVGALLQSSMYRSGATIKPPASTRTYKTIDFSGVTRSIQKVRHFENGGMFDSSATTSNTEGPQQPIVVPAMTEQQEALMQAILQRLRTPPKAYVVLSEIEAAGDKLSQIKDDSTFAKQ